MVRKLRMFVIAGLVVGALVAASLAIAGVLDKPLKSPKVPPSKHFTAGHEQLSGGKHPTNSTAGFGDFTADLVSDTQLHYTLRYSGLEGGNTLFARVHIGQRGTAGGVMFFLCGGGGKPPAPRPGEISGDVTASDVIGPSGQGVSAGEFDEAVKAMRAGYAYANVHTVTYVRGRDPWPDQLGHRGEDRQVDRLTAGPGGIKPPGPSFRARKPAGNSAAPGLRCPSRSSADSIRRSCATVISGSGARESTPPFLA